MTDVFGPFDGINWTQDAWYRHAPKWVPSGVNGSPAASTTTGDLPITFSGLNFTIGVGRGWVRGAGFERSGTPSSQAIAANGNASLSRRDRVVLRRDLAAKTVAPVLIQGTPSASPTAPAVQQNETGQWDQLLYSFLVPPNSGTSISGVVDERVYVDPFTGEVWLATMASRPTASSSLVGMRVRPMDDPRSYVCRSTGTGGVYAWYQDGFYYPTVPANAYMRRDEFTAVATITNAGGGFNIPAGAYAAAPVMVMMVPGDNAANFSQVVPVGSNHTASTIAGVAFTPTGQAIPNGSAIRVNSIVYGYLT